jgi:hypothetical protein
MPNMISTCGYLNTFDADPTSAIIQGTTPAAKPAWYEGILDAGLALGKSYLETQANIQAAKAQNQISAAQAQLLLAQAQAQKAEDDAKAKKMLPLYIGGGVAVLALLFFVMRRK